MGYRGRTEVVAVGKVTWTVGNQTNVEPKQSDELLPHWEEAITNEKTSKGQLVWAQRYNAMREACLKNGLMKKK